MSNYLWPLDCSSPSSSVQEVLQARMVEWVAISFFTGSPQTRIQPTSPALAGKFFTTESSGKSLCVCICYYIFNGILHSLSFVCAVLSSFGHVRFFAVLWTVACSSVHGDSPGKNTGVDCEALLQGSSKPRDQTLISYVSCIDRQVLYH